MNYKLTTLDTINQYDLPIAYVNSQTLTFKDMFVIDNYEYLVEENVSFVLSKTNYINAYERDSNYFLNITNIPNTILITNKFFFDANNQNYIPLFYKYKSTINNYLINKSLLSAMEQTFDITFNPNNSFIASRIMHTSISTLPITDYPNVPTANRKIKIYDITSETPVLVNKDYYTIDYSTFTVYFTYKYFSDLTPGSNNVRQFKVAYLLAQNPIIYEITNNRYVLPELIIKEEQDNSFLVDIMLYTNSKYSMNMAYNGFSFIERIIPEKVYRRIENDISLVEQSYKFVSPSQYNNYQTSILIGDSCPFSRYVVVNELDTSTILNIQTDDTQIITNDHFYINTTYGMIYRSKEANPLLPDTPGLTYEIKNPTINNGDIYEAYTGLAINLGNKTIKLTHDDIIYTYNNINKTFSGITVTRNNLILEIVDYDDESHLVTLNEEIYDSDIITVSYVYRKKTIIHKSFCLNPTPYHAYHNYGIINKIIVVGIVAKEALIPIAPMSVFPFYLDRYINNIELYYTYDTIKTILEDPNIVLGTPNDIGISIPELKRYLVDDYLVYNETDGYQHKVPIMILGIITLLNTMDVNCVTVYNINRQGYIKNNNSDISELQSRFDSAYYNSYPININNIFNVNVFNKMLDILSRKMFNKPYDELDDHNQFVVKKHISDRISYRMFHDKRCIINYIND